jgi:LDH2 family malate/lactate/ureidoglycolate dehydrogenase
VNGPYQFDRRSGCGQLMFALNISAFQSLDEFNSRMEELILETKSVPLAKGCEEIFYPGELEARSEKENRSRGIQLPHDTLEDLRTMAKTAGLQSLLPF